MKSVPVDGTRSPLGAGFIEPAGLFDLRARRRGSSGTAPHSRTVAGSLTEGGAL
jgi:hypothetical protein